VLAVIITDDLRRDAGRVFERELRARIPDVRVFNIDGRVADSLMEPVTDAVINAKAVIMAVYAVPSAGRSMRVGGARGGAPAIINRVLKIGARKTALVAMGNPYIAGDYPDVQTYMCTFSDSPTSETAAVKALFSEIPTRGKLPVTLPGIGERGTGLDHNAVAKSRSLELKEMLAPLYAWLR
jgi:beta-N-acetylhexosaminidase